MSYVVAATEYVAAAASDLANIGASLNVANNAALVPTSGVLAAGADEVSAAIAALFGAHAQAYQALSAQAALFHQQFVQLMNSGANLYSNTESSNAALQGAGAAAPAAAAASSGFGAQPAAALVNPAAVPQLGGMLSSAAYAAGGAFGWGGGGGGGGGGIGGGFGSLASAARSADWAGAAGANGGNGGVSDASHGNGEGGASGASDGGGAPAFSALPAGFNGGLGAAAAGAPAAHAAGNNQSEASAGPGLGEGAHSGWLHDDTEVALGQSTGTGGDSAALSRMYGHAAAGAVAPAETGAGALSRMHGHSGTGGLAPGSGFLAGEGAPAEARPS